jgi:2,4-dienoyl-CoA reductase-like NADH-dependent reductase (Old Yellow Enzyme family)/thioredoxin reductase
VLKNRFVGLPLGLSGYVDITDSPTERMVAMYGRRAAGGAAMITVEATYVEECEVSRRGLLGFYSDKQIPVFSVLTDAIHRGGALAGLQITNRWHTDFPYDLGTMSPTDIESTIDAFVRGSVRAQAAGFDVVEIHVAHGWPLSRFASPLFNHRHDKYGDYAFVPSEVVRRTRAAVGPNVVVAIRLSILESEMEGKAGITLDQTINQLCPAFEDAGVDLLSLTFGQGPIAPDLKDYNATEILYVAPGDKLAAIKAVKETVGVPVLGRSRFTDPDLAARALKEGAMDLVGMGRQLLADPDFPAKLEDGRSGEIVRCIGCDFCAGGVGLQGKTLHCAVNPTTGREVEASWPSVRIRQPKRVLVAGGGVAGMEAALRLSQLSCEVVLAEQRDALGGLLALAAGLPNLRLVDLGWLVEDLKRKLAASTVEVRLGAPVTESMLKQVKPAALVVAVGSVAGGANGWQPGADPRVDLITLPDYLGGGKAGRRVVVDGRGEGAEVAVSLARQGHEVTLVEVSSRLAPLRYDYTMRRLEALNDYMKEESIRALWGSHIEAVKGSTVSVRRRNGRLETAEADTILIAGRTPAQVCEGADGQVPSIFHIGDCRSPRGLGEALDEARQAAFSIAG